MSIRIVAVGRRYEVEVTPPHAGPWASSGPMKATEVLTALSGMGCHSTDITDALSEADARSGGAANWVAEHDAEVRRRRSQE